jgi:hypothetical protein
MPPPAYAPPYQAPHRTGGYAPARTSTSPRTALVLSCLGICCVVTSIIGVVLGFKSLKEIEASGGLAPGRGEALAAVVIGFAIIGFNVLLFLASLGGSGSGS